MKNPFRFLTEQDLQLRDRIIFIDALDELSTESKNTLRTDVNANTLIVLFKTHKRLNNIIHRIAINDENIRLFSWHPFDFKERRKSDDLAFSNLNIAYNKLIREKKVPVSHICWLYQDENAELVIKKMLLKELNEYYQFSIAKSFLKKSTQEILVLPSLRWQKIDGIVGENSDKINKNETVIFNRPKWTHQIANQIKYAIKVIGIAWYVLKNVRALKNKNAPEEYSLGVRLYHSGWQLDGNGYYEADWMFLKESNDKAKTLFVCESQLKAETYKFLHKRGYNAIDMSARAIFKEVSMDFLWKELILKGLVYLLRLLKNLTRTSVLFHPITLQAGMDYLRWKNFVYKYKIANYLTYNDLSFGHIFRNIILSQTGCKSIFFDHSNGRHFMYDARESSKILELEADRGFMFYSEELHWGRRHIDAAKRSHSKSGGFDVLGPIWNASIERSNTFSQLMAERWGENIEGPIIAAFNDGLHLDQGSGPVSETEHLRFLESLLHLLSNPKYPGVKIVFKLKQPENFFRNLGLGGTGISSVFQVLEQNDRFLMLDKDFSIATIMRRVDLGLSMAFTTPSIEALISGKRAFYFDAANSYQHSFFDRLPNLVAHNEAEMIELLNFWLTLPEEELNRYLVDYIKTDFCLCDLQALIEFRKKVMIH